MSNIKVSGVEFDNLTTTQRNALVNPAKGLTIYNVTTGLLETNDGTTGSPVWNPAGGAATNLSIANKTTTTLDVASDTGTDATIPAATITEAGLLQATDKVKLDATSGSNTGDEVSASETVEGIVERATQAETDAGVDDTRFVTPAKLSNFGNLNSKISHSLIAFSDATPTAGGISISVPNPAGTNAIASCFEFKGSTSEGTPTSITIVLDANNASPTHTVEVYDITNAQSIGSVTGRAITGKSIMTIGTLSNIPASAAIFELRIRKDGGGALTVVVSSLSMNY